MPICFQLSTLIFGYIRKKKETKYRLEVQRSQEIENVRTEDSITTLTSRMSRKGSYFDPPLAVSNNTSITDSSSVLLSNGDKSSKHKKDCNRVSKRLSKKNTSAETCGPMMSTQSREQLIEAHHIQQEVSKRMINNGFTFRSTQLKSKEPSSVANQSMEDSV